MKVEIGNLIATAKQNEPLCVNRGIMEIIECIKPHITKVWELRGKDYVCVWERKSK